MNKQIIKFLRLRVKFQEVLEKTGTDGHEIFEYNKKKILNITSVSTLESLDLLGE